MGGFHTLLKQYFGAVGRNRTGDLFVTSELLYQLSYNGVFKKIARTPFVCGAALAEQLDILAAI